MSAQGWVPRIVIAGGLVLGASVYARKVYASMVQAPSVTPSVKVPDNNKFPANTPAPSSSAPTASGVYTTPLDKLVLPPIAPFTRKSGKVVRVTCIPFGDALRGPKTFARATYADWLRYTAKLGARMMTPDLSDELWAATGLVHLTPCILPATANMASRAWCDRADACVWAKLDASGWNGYSPANVNQKDWLAGAPSGRALNYGMYDPDAPNGRMWQSVGTRHDASHVDYSQLLRCYWEA